MNDYQEHQPTDQEFDNSTRSEGISFIDESDRENLRKTDVSFRGKGHVLDIPGTVHLKMLRLDRVFGDQDRSVILLDDSGFKVVDRSSIDKSKLYELDIEVYGGLGFMRNILQWDIRAGNTGQEIFGPIEDHGIWPADKPKPPEEELMREPTILNTGMFDLGDGQRRQVVVEKNFDILSSLRGNLGPRR